MEYLSVLIQQHAGPTGSVLIVKNRTGEWQLPAGSIRTCESDADAVSRIAWEQLNMKVTPGKLALLGRKYPKDGTVEHIVCGNITHNTHTKCNYHKYYEAVNTWQTEPHGNVYTDYAWVHPTQLAGYGLCGDDESFIARYDPWINGREIPDRRMY